MEVAEKNVYYICSAFFASSVVNWSSFFAVEVIGLLTLNYDAIGR